MTKWLPFELHTHSVHSDAKFEVKELVEAIKEIGFRGVALTDHNAISGQTELLRECEEQGIIGIRGTEWTTYYGHMIVLGEKGCTDWRCYSKENIEDGIRKIRKNDGIVEITHPFAVSDPLSTGYHWQFDVKDYSLVNYIEVWSREFATISVQSKNAFDMWEKLLLQGYHIGALCGRDWHSKEDRKKNYSYTYLGIKGEESEVAVLEALRAGRAYVTMGPRLILNIQSQHGRIYEIGDNVEEDILIFDIKVDEDTDFDSYKQFGIEPEYIRVIHNGVTLYEKELENQNNISMKMMSGYMRIEIWGNYLGEQNRRLVFTNPLYIV